MQLSDYTGNTRVQYVESYVRGLSKLIYYTIERLPLDYQFFKIINSLKYFRWDYFSLVYQTINMVYVLYVSFSTVIDLQNNIITTQFTNLVFTKTQFQYLL